MVAIAVSHMLPHIDLRQHDADMLAQIAHLVQGIDGEFAARLLPSHDEDYVVGELDRDEGIGNRFERRRVEDDEIELVGQAFTKARMTLELRISAEFGVLRLAET